MDKKKEVIAFIKTEIANETKVAIASIKNGQSFFELGLDSINAIYLLELIEKEYNLSLTPLLFWDYPTIESFAENLVQNHLTQ